MALRQVLEPNLRSIRMCLQHTRRHHPVMPHLVHQARQDVAPGGPRRKRDNRVGLRWSANRSPLLLPRVTSGTWTESVALSES